MKKLLLLFAFFLSCSIYSQQYTGYQRHGKKTSEEINAIDVSKTNMIYTAYNTDLGIEVINKGSGWEPRFTGDASGGSWNHSATQNIELNGYNIIGPGTIATSGNIVGFKSTFDRALMNPTNTVPSEEEGAMYWDDSENRLMGYDGTAWKPFLLDGDTVSTGSSTGIVAEGIIHIDGESSEYTVTHNLGYIPDLSRIYTQKQWNFFGSDVVRVQEVTTTTFNIGVLGSSSGGVAWAIFGESSGSGSNSTTEHNNGYIYADTYGIVGDGTTDNTTAFTTAATAQSNLGKVLVFGEGTFNINATSLELADIDIKGIEGKTFFVGDGTVGNYLFKPTSKMKIEGVTFSGYDRLIYLDGSLEVLDLTYNTFKDNRDEVFYSTELTSNINSNIDYLNFSHNKIINTPGFFHNGTVGRGIVNYNYLDSWMRDLTLYPDETIKTRNWGIQIGNAYDVSGTLTPDQTQDLTGNITAIGNVAKNMNKPISSGIDMVALLFMGHQVDVSYSKLTDIYDTNESAEDVAGIYFKAHTGSIDHNKLTRVGSKGYDGEGAITIKGYNRDGLGHADGSQDGVTYAIQVTNNILTSDVSGFKNAFWLSTVGENILISDNTLDGYEKISKNLPNNSRFSGNEYFGLTEGLITNTTEPVSNLIFENEHIIDFKPTEASAFYSFRNGSFNNISFNNITATVDLQNYTESNISFIRMISNDGEINNNITTNNIKWNINNSPLTDSQYLVRLPYSGTNSSYDGLFKNTFFDTDGTESWGIKNEALSEVANLKVEGVYDNNVKRPESNSDIIYTTGNAEYYADNYLTNGNFTDSGVGNLTSRNGGVLENLNNQLKITSDGSNNASAAQAILSISDIQGDSFFVSADIVSIIGNTRFYDYSNNVAYTNLVAGETFSTTITLGAEANRFAFGGDSDTTFELVLDNWTIQKVIPATELASEVDGTFKVNGDLYVNGVLYGTSSDVADGSITENKYADDSIWTTKIKSGAITGSKISNSTIDFGKINPYYIATQSQAEEGILTDRIMTPLRVKDAIEYNRSNKTIDMTITAATITAANSNFIGENTGEIGARKENHFTSTTAVTFDGTVTDAVLNIPSIWMADETGSVTLDVGAGYTFTGMVTNDTDTSVWLTGSETITLSASDVVSVKKISDTEFRIFGNANAQ